MKRLFALLLCLLTVVAVALSLTGCGSADNRLTVDIEGQEKSAGSLTVALTSDYAPYLYETDGGLSGIDVEAAEAVADKLDMKFHYVRDERDNVEKGLKDGAYDLALCGYTAKETNEIKELTDNGLTLSDSYYGFILAVLIDSSTNLKPVTEENVNDTDYAIGVKKDTAAQALLERDVTDQDRIHVYDTGVDAVNAIVSQEVDCVVIDVNPAHAYEEEFENIKLMESPYSHGAFYFVGADSALIVKMNNAIEALKGDHINSIEEKYILDDIDFWTPVKIWFNKLKYDFYRNFIEKERWRFLVTGLGNTLLLTLLAACLGVIIGIIIAAIRTTHDNNLETLKHNGGIAYYLMRFFNAISKLYLTIIRGTPVFVQLLIIFFVIFASSKNKMMVAVLAFGINSGAYVAEILRGGIMAIDKGQFEAGRSIGFNYVQTMWYIIIPQVLKNVLPTLLNEFIALLKETSVACYVGVLDLTRAGNIIRGTTFTDMLPLLAVAVIYLVVVLILTKLVSLLERRLRKSER